MTIPTELRRFAIPIAWLATAAITFGLGRLTSPGDAAARARAAAQAQAANSSATSHGNPSEQEAEELAERVRLSQLAGSPEEGLKQLTNGRPIEDWLKLLLAQEDEVARMSGFMRMLELIQTSDDFGKAVNSLLKNYGGWNRSKEYSMILQKWAQIDPKAAMDFVGALKDDRNRLAGSRTILATWARRSPQEAIAWAEANGKAAGGDGEQRVGNWAMATVVSQLSKSDVGWALRLAESQPASRARGAMVDNLISQLISQKGDAGAREAVMNITDPALRDAMIGKLAGQMANNDPKLAAQWISTLPAGDGRRRALTELVAQWSDKDPIAAANFLTQFPASPETDESRGRLAMNVVRKDPESALAWASTISEEQYRTNTISELVRNWLRRDTEAAKQWVTASGYPDDVKAKLLTPQRGGGGGGRGFGGPGGGGGGGRGQGGGGGRGGGQTGPGPAGGG